MLANKSVATKMAVVPKGRKPKYSPTVFTRAQSRKDGETQCLHCPFRLQDSHRGNKDGGIEEPEPLVGRCQGQERRAGCRTRSLACHDESARYSIHNIGHYGLMFQYYTHFTSPICRYPASGVYRLLTRLLKREDVRSMPPSTKSSASMLRTWSSWQLRQNVPASSTSR